MQLIDFINQILLINRKISKIKLKNIKIQTFAIPVVLTTLLKNIINFKILINNKNKIN